MICGSRNACSEVVPSYVWHDDRLIKRLNFLSCQSREQYSESGLFTHKSAPTQPLFANDYHNNRPKCWYDSGMPCYKLFLLVCLSNVLSVWVVKCRLWGLVGNGIYFILFDFLFGWFWLLVIFLYWERKECQINISCLPAEKSIKHRHSIFLSKLWSEIESCRGSLRTEENSHLNLSLASCIHYMFKYMYIHEHIIETDVQVVCSKKESEKEIKVKCAFKSRVLKMLAFLKFKFRWFEELNRIQLFEDYFV